MARHSNSHSDFSVPRSLTTRIFALLTLALPAIFYLLSLAFALKTIYSPAYAESIVYDDTPQIANATNSTTPLTQKSSPFYSCNPYPAGGSLSDIQATVQTCTREHLWGSTGFAICRAFNAGDQHICQQRVYSAGLYVAGTVLAGLALLSAVIALGLGFSRAIASSETLPYAFVYSRLAQTSRSHQHNHRHQQHGDNWKGLQDETEPQSTEDGITHDSPGMTATGTSSTWRNFALALGILLAVTGALCLFVAHYLAFNALVEDQQPSGDVSLSRPVNGSRLQSPWYLTHTGVVYASMAWLTAGLGALIASLGGCLGGL